MKRSLLLLVTLGIVMGCSSTPPVHLGGIGNTSWQLVKFQGGDGTVLTPDDKAKYTVAFANDFVRHSGGYLAAIPVFSVMTTALHAMPINTIDMPRSTTLRPANARSKT